MTPDSLASKVKAAREALGLSQERLAQRVGCCSDTIYRIENGDTKNPGARVFKALERELGLTLPAPAT